MTSLCLATFSSIATAISAELLGLAEKPGGSLDPL